MKIFKLSDSGKQLVKIAEAPSSVGEYGRKIFDYVVKAEDVLEEERRHIANITKGGKNLSDDFKTNFENEYSQLMRTLEFSHTLADLMANGGVDAWEDAKANGIKRKKFDSKRGSNALQADEDAEYVSDSAEQPKEESLTNTNDSTQSNGDPLKDVTRSPSDSGRPSPSSVETDRQSPIPSREFWEGLEENQREDFIRRRGGMLSQITTKTVSDVGRRIDDIVETAKNIEIRDTLTTMTDRGLEDVIKAVSLAVAFFGGDYLGDELKSKELSDINGVTQENFDKNVFIEAANRSQKVVWDIIFEASSLKEGDKNEALQKNLEHMIATAKSKSAYEILVAEFKNINRAQSIAFKFMKIADSSGFDLSQYKDKIQTHYQAFLAQTQETIELQKAFVYYVDMMARVVSNAYKAVSAEVETQGEESPLANVQDGLKWMGRLVQNMQARGENAIDDWESVKESGLSKMTADEMASLVDDNEDGMISIDEFFQAATDEAVSEESVSLINEKETTEEPEPADEDVVEDEAQPNANVNLQLALFDSLFEQARNAVAGDEDTTERRGRLRAFAKRLIDKSDAEAARHIASQLALGSFSGSDPNLDNFYRLIFPIHIKDNLLKEENAQKIRSGLERILLYEGSFVQSWEDDMSYIEKNIQSESEQPEQQAQAEQLQPAEAVPDAQETSINRESVEASVNAGIEQILLFINGESEDSSFINSREFAILLETTLEKGNNKAKLDAYISSGNLKSISNAINGMATIFNTPLKGRFFELLESESTGTSDAVTRLVKAIESIKDNQGEEADDSSMQV